MTRPTLEASAEATAITAHLRSTFAIDDVDAIAVVVIWNDGPTVAEALQSLHEAGFPAEQDDDDRTVKIFGQVGPCHISRHISARSTVLLALRHPDPDDIPDPQALTLPPAGLSPENPAEQVMFHLVYDRYLLHDGLGIDSVDDLAAAYEVIDDLGGHAGLADAAAAATR
jgi:hypothetical protein